jgi:hypothetical protein
MWSLDPHRPHQEPSQHTLRNPAAVDGLVVWVRHTLKGTEWQVSAVIGVTDGRLVLTHGHKTFFADEVHEI